MIVHTTHVVRGMRRIYDVEQQVREFCDTAGRVFPVGRWVATKPR
ncbi:hypothetical protein [Saccharothrix deserti]|nr:hypothetical protein [Saccharothrix deserti]